MKKVTDEKSKKPKNLNKEEKFDKNDKFKPEDMDKIKSIALKLKKMLTDSLQPVEGAAELAEKVRNDLAVSGTSNDLTQKQSLGSDMVNSLDNGIPGYQITGEDHAIDEVENQTEVKHNPVK